MNAATSCVEFSYNNVMIRQIYSVAADSPLGPALANNLMGYWEYKTVCFHLKTFLYQTNVDEIFLNLQPKHNAINFSLFFFISLYGINFFFKFWLVYNFKSILDSVRVWACFWGGFGPGLLGPFTTLLLTPQMKMYLSIDK